MLPAEKRPVEGSLPATPLQLRLFYSELAEAMEDADVDAKELANRLGVHVRSVQVWMRAGDVPKARAIDVQRALGVESPLSTPTLEEAVSGLAWRRLADGRTFVPVEGHEPPPGYELVFLD